MKIVEDQHQRLPIRELAKYLLQALGDIGSRNTQRNRRLERLGHVLSIQPRGQLGHNSDQLLDGPRRKRRSGRRIATDEQLEDLDPGTVE